MATGNQRKRPAAKGGARSKKKKTISLDLSDVKGFKGCPDGNWPADIVEVEEKASSNNNDMLVITWEVTDGPGKGCKMWDNIPLMESTLWRIRKMLECIGYDIPDKQFDLDPEDLVGESGVVQVTNEVYEGKNRPKVTDYILEDELPEDLDEEDEEEEDDYDPDASDVPDDEEEEDEEDQEEDEEDDEEDEEEEEKPASKKSSKTSKASSAKKAPAKKAPAKKAPAKKFTPKVGSKVKFNDDDGDVVKGIINDIDDDIAKVEDADGDEWEVDVSELSAAR